MEKAPEKEDREPEEKSDKEPSGAGNIPPSPEIDF